jgi:hypothetical protein
MALAVGNFDRTGNPGLLASEDELAGGMWRPFREIQGGAIAFFGKFQRPASDFGARVLRSGRGGGLRGFCLNSLARSLGRQLAKESIWKEYCKHRAKDWT